MSPTGSAAGDGSIGNPWDVYTAFNQPASVKPGDTLWLRGGIYIPEDPSWPAIQCYLQGTPAAPIIVRQYPGERAIFQEVPYPQYTGPYDQYCLYMDSGGYVWFWDFELRSTNTTRYTSQTGSDPTPTQLPIPNSCQIAAPGVKLINMVIHDCRGGVGFFANALNSEAYGCLIYNNGWAAPDRGHGHGLYLQNQNGLMTMSDNMVFNQFGLGIHGYTVGSYLQHFLIENNAVFNNGAIAQYPDINVGEQILFGNVTITDLNIISNYIYQPFGVYSSLLQLDYGLVTGNTGVVLNNYIAGGDGSGSAQYGIYANNYQSLVVSGNTVYVNGYMLGMQNNASSKSDYNTFYGNSSANFYNGSSLFTLSGWQSATGYDLHSTYNQNVTPPNKIIVNPNAFQTKRANIIVYNWANSNSVNVDVSNVLTPGDNYEVMNAQNWFGTPVLIGTYNGSPISLPMTNLPAAAPNGWSNSAAIPVTGSQFNVFVLVGSNGCLGAASVISPPTNQTAQAGAAAVLTVTATGVPPLLYHWQTSLNGTGTWNNLAGATNTSYTTSTLTTNDSGTQFRAIVSSTCGSPVTSTVATVTVIPAPVFTSGYAGLIISNSPVAYWRLNEANGAIVAHDFFGVYNGTIGAGVIGGVPGPQNPQFGGFENTNTAMQLTTAAGSYLTMPTLLLDANTVTITGWMNPNGFQGGWAGVVFCRGGTTVSGLNFGPGSPANELRYTWNNNGFNTSTGLIVPTNQWSFFALVASPAGATVYLGTSGVLNSYTDTTPLGSSAFDGFLYLGYDPQSGGRPFSGVLDEVAVFKQSLSPAQIQQLYSNALVAPPPSPGFQQWQTRYFGSTNAANACATCDADGTGQNNLFKYVAGLNPTNPASKFILSVANVPGLPTQQDLAYSPITTSRIYTVQFITDLVSGTYSNLTTINGLQTNGTQVILTDTNAVQTQKFYRVQITLP